MITCVLSLNMLRQLDGIVFNIMHEYEVLNKNIFFSFRLKTGCRIRLNIVKRILQIRL